MSATDDGARTAAWYPDPYRRHELRFHDGAIWTEHVSDRGVPGLDTVPVASGPRSRPPDRTAGVDAPPLAEREVARVVPESQPVEGGLLGALILAVDDSGTTSRAGIDCAIRDQRGHLIGTVRVARDPLARRALRLLTSDDERVVARVDVLDEAGQRVLRLDRPGRRLKPRITVRRGDGSAVGEIVSRQVFTRSSSTLEAGGYVVGTVEGDGPRDHDLRVVDHTGATVGRVSRTWEVLAASHHPTVGTHVVQLAGPLPEPLRSLTLASLLGAEAMIVSAAVAVA